MSGDLVFVLTCDDGYEFRAILLEGLGFGDIGTYEPPGIENWIWVFPFSEEYLERACEEVELSSNNYCN